MKIKVNKKRRRQGKTDYRARMNLLRGGKARIIFRKTNRYIVGQYVKSSEAKDKVIAGVLSKELLKFSWPKEAEGSLKSIPACYLSGYLLGKRILNKEKEASAIFDMGLLRDVKRSRIYGFLKGIADSGIKLRIKEETIPDKKRISGEHMKNKVDVNKIMSEIDNKFK